MFKVNFQGFETKSTEFALERLALHLLYEISAMPNEFFIKDKDFTNHKFFLNKKQTNTNATPTILYSIEPVEIFKITRLNSTVIFSNQSNSVTDKTKSFVNFNNELRTITLTEDEYFNPIKLNYTVKYVNSNKSNDKMDKTIISNISTTTNIIEQRELLMVNHDDYGTGYDPTWSDITTSCSQYIAVGKFIPYNMLQLLTKVIFKVKSFDSVIILKYFYLNYDT